MTEQPITTTQEYRVVDERRFIAKSDDPEIYALEETAHNAFSRILDHRTRKYGENRYREALPSELVAFLESYDGYASYIASREYILSYLTRIGKIDPAVKLLEIFRGI